MMSKWIGDRITNFVDAVLAALVPVILVGGAVIIAFVGREEVTVPAWVAVLLAGVLIVAIGASVALGHRLRLIRSSDSPALRRAVASITEELEHSEHVLTGSDAAQFFVIHKLADEKWKAYGAALVDAGLAELHKTLRTAYRSIDALNNRGVQRRVVYSDGTPTTIVNHDRSQEAIDAIQAALRDLQSTRS